MKQCSVMKHWIEDPQVIDSSQSTSDICFSCGSLVTHKRHIVTTKEGKRREKKGKKEKRREKKERKK
jgi:hypothetical protein